MSIRNTLCKFAIIAIILFLNNPIKAQVSINLDNTDPDPSAMLDVKSSERGILIPRMTSLQRNSISNPAIGLFVFDTSTNSFWYYSGLIWKEITLNTDDQNLSLSGNNLVIEGGNSVDLSSLPFANSWRLTGNSGTIEGINFIGTTDNKLLDFRANNKTGLKIQYRSNPVFQSINIVGGYWGNSIGSLGIGNVIAGGGIQGLTNQINTPNDHGGYSAIGGGYGNIITGDISNISGGSENAIGTVQHGTISGGYANQVNGQFGTVPGGKTNWANGDYSFAAGFTARALHRGTFVWKDGAAGVFSSTGENQFLVKAGGGVGINKNNPSSALDVNGTVTATAFAGDGSALTNVPDNQTISLIGNSLSIENGNSIDLSVINTPQSLVQDLDNDTKIQVEESPDEDIIRFDLGGTEHFKMKTGRLEVLNTGKSVFLGMEAGENDDLTDNKNTFVGYAAGKSNTTGELNVAVGSNSLQSITTGSANTSIGSNSNTLNTTGSFNVSIGAGSLGNNSSGAQNTMLGNGAGQDLSSGSQNVGVGFRALNAMETGSGNVAVGYNSLSELYGNSSNNTAVGHEAGGENNGSGNVFLGFRAGFNENNSNKLYIDNSASNNPLIYGEFDNNLLRINGTLNINNSYSLPASDGTLGQIMVTNGTGDVTWADKTVDTDDQTLNLSGTNLSIEDGNSVDLSVLPFANNWNLNGNSGTMNGTNFIGTTDNVALDIRVNNQRAFRIIPNYDNSINIIGGYSGNNISSEINSATISGGGGPGVVNSISAEAGTIGGGFQNIVSGITAVISGGINNLASGESSTVGGGESNTSSGMFSTVAGGAENQASGKHSFAAGIGAKALHNGSFVWNGESDYSTFSSTGNEQFLIKASGGVGIGKNNPSSALDVNGTVTATAFAGDGSALTNVPDNQNLSISGTTLSIEDGNSVNLSGIDTDDQTLSLSGSTLSIDGGNSVNLSTITGDHLGNHTAEQNINLNGKYLSGDGDNEGVFIMTNGNVGIGMTNPNQQLEITGNFRLPSTTSSTGIIFSAGQPLLHSFGSNNFFAGKAAGNLSMSGFGWNTGLGTMALKANSTGFLNTALGAFSLLENTIGNDNTAIGSEALRNNTEGNNNTVLGRSSMQFNTMGSRNTAIGRDALYNNNTGSNNTVLGYLSGVNITNENNNILIDNPGVATENNAIYLGKSGTHNKTVLAGNVGIGTSIPSEKLHVNNGDILISKTASAQVSLSLQSHMASGNQRTWMITTQSNPSQADGSDLGFYREGNERMRLDSDGNLGLGVIPSNKLSVAGIVDISGKLGVGITSPTYKAQIEGSVSGSTEDDYVVLLKNKETDPDNSTRYNVLKIQGGKQNNNGANSRMIAFYRPDNSEIGSIRQDNSNSVSYNTSSDVRLKQNIRPTHYILDDLLKIEVKDYEFKAEPGEEQTGFIAQQLFDVYPNAVAKGGDNVKTDPWMVDYGQLTPLLVKAIQDQQAIIESQKLEIESLKQENEKRFAQLETAIRQLSAENNIARKQ